MKRFLSIFLTLLMLLSTLGAAPFSAHAAEAYAEILLDAPQTAELASPNTAGYTFTAPESSYYEISVTSPRTKMLKTVVTDEAGVTVAEKSVTYPVYVAMEKGKTYTVISSIQTNDFFAPVTTSITAHAHTLKPVNVKPTCKTDGKTGESCSACSYTDVQTIKASDDYHEFVNGKCLTCRKTDPDYVKTVHSLSLDTPVNGSITKFSECIYYEFTPEETGCYCFRTEAETSGLTLQYSAANGTSGFGRDVAYAELTAGVPCQLSVYYNESYTNRIYEKEGDYTLTLTRHEHNYVVYRNTVTCSKAGTVSSKCDVCGKHKFEELEADGVSHLFKNGVCKYCGLAEEGYTAARTVLTTGEPATLVSVKGQDVFFSYTPEEDGYYYFTGEQKDKAAYYEIYDGTGALVYGQNYVPKAVYRQLSGGVTYTIKAWSSFETIDTAITLKAEKHEHTISESYSKYPTCVDEGTKHLNCYVCGYKATEPIPATGEHLFINGHCKYCDAVDETYVKTVTALSENEPYVFDAVAAGEEVYFTFTPSVTGKYGFLTQKSKTGNGMYTPTVLVYDEENNTVKPTYTNTASWVTNEYRFYDLEAGKPYSITAKANEALTLTFTLSLHEHNYKSNGYTLRCNDYVTATFSCSCGDKYTVTYEPTGEHQFVETVVAPTCVEGGYSEMKCKGCGITYKYSYTPENSANHQFENGVCTLCGAYENEDGKTQLQLNSVTAFTMKDEDEELEAFFTPGETGFYYFRSLGSYDLYAELYDADFNEVNEDDDSGYGENFLLAARLEANKEYRLFIGGYEDFEDLEVTEITFDVLCGVHNHSYSAEKVAPTAETKGFTLHECACGDTYVTDVKDKIEATPCAHNYVKYRTFAPTCTDKGYTLYYCTKCYDSYEADKKEPTGTHSYFGGYCEYCGQRYPRTVTASDSELLLDTPAEVTLASKDEKAFLTFKAEESGTYLFRTKGTYNIYAVLYDEDGKQLAVDSENSGPGKNAQLCYEMTAGHSYRFELQLNNGSNAAFTAQITKHAHTFVHYIVPPTCGEDGIGIHTCTDCFYSYEDVPEYATGKHTFNENGECTVCGYSDPLSSAVEVTDFTTVTVPAFKDYMLYTFTAPHTGTLTVEGLSDSFTVGFLLADDFSELQMDNEAQGNGMNFRLSLEVKLGVRYYLIVNSLQHTYDVSFNYNADHHYLVVNVVEPTCTEKGLTISRCSECGRLDYSNDAEPVAHDYSAAVTKQPTCTETGVKTFTCTVCGSSYTEALPAKGHTPVKDAARPSDFKSAGITEGLHCADCGEVLKKQYPIAKLGSPKIKKLKKGKRKITVTWNKVDNVNGYQLQYSTGKRFKKAKTVTVKNSAAVSKKLKKLKAKKKYYVRIRAYKTVNGTKQYSKWSKKKAVKTK